MDKKIISMEEKIKRIESTNSLNKVSLECLPPIQTDKYYFVSYSHKDYKQVYKDIFYLQQSGFSIWYDRGMEAGKNWKDTAEKYIAKHNCAGVIFFLSENSILSNAIHEEIKLLIENGKEFLTINLPFDNIYMSAKEMIALLKEKGIQVEKEKDEFISKYLNEDIIYVRYDASYEEKIEKINTLKSSPLLKMKKFNFLTNTDEVEKDAYNAILTNEFEFLESSMINDLDVKEIFTNDFIKSLDEFDSLNKLLKIGDSTFSNCRKLKSIELPNSILVIGSYSFYNCEKLENIDLTKINLIKNNAFENCSNLKSVNLASLINSKIIDDSVFRNCTSLEEVIVPKMLNKIGTYAFENTKIKSFLTSYLYGDGICSYAFNNCKDLETFSILNDGDFQIGKSAFKNCISLKNFNMKKGAVSILDNAFENCSKLNIFPFQLVLKIGKGAFAGCLGLRCLDINAADIDANAFENCKNIEEIKFNEGSKYEIGFNAFSGLTKLKCVHFASKLNFINAYAFARCENLETITLSSDTFHIDQDAFNGCEKLSKIYFDGTVEDFKKLMYQDFDQPWFNKTGEYIVICKDKVISKYEFKEDN